MIFSYLFAIVASNLLVHHYGQYILPLTAFLLIPFDLFARDILHERWRGKFLFPKMAILILSGSVLSFLLNEDSYPIAVASFISFLVAGFIDFISYQICHGSKYKKMVVSNSVSSLADSIVFPLIAFSTIGIHLIAAQWAFKFFGGLMWVWIYKGYKNEN